MKKIVGISSLVIIFITLSFFGYQKFFKKTVPPSTRIIKQQEEKLVERPIKLPSTKKELKKQRSSRRKVAIRVKNIIKKKSFNQGLKKILKTRNDGLARKIQKNIEKVSLNNKEKKLLKLVPLSQQTTFGHLLIAQLKKKNIKNANVFRNYMRRKIKSQSRSYFETGRKMALSLPLEGSNTHKLIIFEEMYQLNTLRAKLLEILSSEILSFSLDDDISMDLNSESESKPMDRKAKRYLGDVYNIYLKSAQKFGGRFIYPKVIEFIGAYDEFKVKQILFKQFISFYPKHKSELLQHYKVNNVEFYEFLTK